MITEDYTSYEVAKLLKEKGFDGQCVVFKDIVKKTFGTTWNTESKCRIPIPTLPMACKWLREVHKVHIGINPISGKGYNATIYDVADFDDYGIISDTEFFFHPEEAVEAAIKYVLENLI